MLGKFSREWDFDPDYNFEDPKNEKIEKLKDLIRMAIIGGEILKIKYHGGTLPGTVREIIPYHFIREMKQIVAKCEHSGRVKMFALSKIEVMDFDSYLTYDKILKGDDLLTTWFDFFMPNRRFPNLSFGVGSDIIEVYERISKGKHGVENKFLQISYYKDAKIKFVLETEDWHRYFYYPRDAVKFMIYMLETAKKVKEKSKKKKKAA